MYGCTEAVTLQAPATRNAATYIAIYNSQVQIVVLKGTSLGKALTGVQVGCSRILHKLRPLNAATYVAIYNSHIWRASKMTRSGKFHCIWAVYGLLLCECVPL